MRIEIEKEASERRQIRKGVMEAYKRKLEECANDRQAMWNRPWPIIPPTPERRFKGVWICAALWDDRQLNFTEKCLIAEIDSLCGMDEETGEEHACFAGNNHLAKRMHMSPTRMRDTLANLTTRGYLVRLGFTGRQTLRCVCPNLSSNPQSAEELIEKYKASGNRVRKSRYRENTTPDVVKIRQQTSRKHDTEISSIDTNRETTTTTYSVSRFLGLNGNGADHGVVVASFFVSEEEEPGSVLDKLSEKFSLSNPQRQEVARLMEEENGLGYVIEKAKIVLSEPRENLAGAFIAAIRDDWKAKKASKPPKRKKVQPAIQKPGQESEEDWNRKLEAARAMRTALSTNLV